MGNSTANWGYRVLDVQANSPASKAGLTSYLDFIIAANGVRVETSEQLFNAINKSEGIELSLKVYNCLKKTTRDLLVMPNKAWGGDSLLGAEIRHDSWGDNELLRVISVVPGSPAQNAGLQPEVDYILGTEETSLSSLDQLANEVLQNDRLTLFVLDRIKGSVRKLVVDVRSEQGLRLLGCDVAQGLLHSPGQIDEQQADLPTEPELPIVHTRSAPPEAIPSPAPPLVIRESVPSPQIKPRITFGTYIIRPPPALCLLQSANPFQPMIKESPYVFMEED